MVSNKFILESLARTCGVCGTALPSDYYYWNNRDDSIELPSPPSFLHAVPICKQCYHDGKTMEDRIIKHLKTIGISLTVHGKVTMPDGTDGYICETCKEFRSFVEPNQSDGSFICSYH